ncbi:MAG: MBL fold metallo-hydrolase [Actinobacteria bacterium]|nr:MBL fold metallo-hydrolase [Actinomycetota bacterium]
MALTESEALEQAALAGIHRLSLPTPFAIGKVNCYLIEDEPLTLVDTGPNSGSALHALIEGLAERGHAVADLELIVLTHNHMDHRGLVEILVEHSGADVAALGAGTRRLADFEAEYKRDDDFAVELLRRSGVPEDVGIALHSVSASYMGWGSPAVVTRPLDDAQTIDFRDRSLTAFFRPGHSPMDTLFWDEERGILLAGDHLLAGVSSNPTVTRPLDGSPGRNRSLVDYVASLRQTREIPAEIVLSGHGAPIVDHVRLIDDRLRKTERRREKMLGLLAEGPRCGYEIAQLCWGDIAVTQAYLTLSEVIGHMDLLEEEGLVREIDDAGITRFKTV